ncbi:hypothetical protein GQ457_04G029070 [Hibiscus cannabinus]
MVTRLALYFPDMIMPTQSAFIKGGSIVDNTLLAQELVKGYSRTTLFPRYALKISLQKAFDSISWEFLGSALEAMGLPIVFIDWIKACITTFRFSVSFNDSLVGFLGEKKG